MDDRTTGPDDRTTGRPDRLGAGVSRSDDSLAEVTPAPIEFVAGDEDLSVTAQAVRLTVRKEMSHDVTCGSKKWFEPHFARYEVERSHLK